MDGGEDRKVRKENKGKKVDLLWFDVEARAELI
jgi:hypothetical protein